MATGRHRGRGGVMRGECGRVPFWHSSAKPKHARREAFEKASLRTRFDRRHARREAFQKASLRTRFGFGRSCQKGVRITWPQGSLSEFIRTPRTTPPHAAHHPPHTPRPWPSLMAMVAIIDGNPLHGNGPSSMALVAMNDGMDGNPHCYQ